MGEGNWVRNSWFAHGKHAKLNVIAMMQHMQHCQNRHFKTIYSGSGNLGFGPLRKIGALSSTS